MWAQQRRLHGIVFISRFFKLVFRQLNTMPIVIGHWTPECGEVMEAQQPEVSKDSESERF